MFLAIQHVTLIDVSKSSTDDDLSCVPDEQKKYTEILKWTYMYTLVFTKNQAAATKMISQYNCSLIFH